jgi:hypothetical protein
MKAILLHHPDPFRSVTREAFEREAERAVAAEVAGSRADAICALMRLGAVLGDHNGHTGIFARDPHARPLHFYPLRVYESEDGFDLHANGLVCCLSGRERRAVRQQTGSTSGKQPIP